MDQKQQHKANTKDSHAHPHIEVPLGCALGPSTKTAGESLPYVAHVGNVGPRQRQLTRGIATEAFTSSTGATRLLCILHIFTIQLRSGPHPRECQLRVRLAIDAPSVLCVTRMPTPTPNHPPNYPGSQYTHQFKVLCVCVCEQLRERERGRGEGGKGKGGRERERASESGRECELAAGQAPA